MTYAVPNIEQTIHFVVNILGFKEIPARPELAKQGIKWVRIPNSKNELHFVPINKNHKSTNKIMEIEKVEKMIDQLFKEKVENICWTDWFNNHAGIMIKNSSYYKRLLRKLEQNHIKFFGPIYRSDKVLQIYVSIPHGIIMEFDYQITLWDELFDPYFNKKNFINWQNMFLMRSSPKCQ